MNESIPRIFISHSSQDNDFGIKLAQDLRHVLGDDTAVWYDISGGLQVGDAWWRTIVKELTARPVFIVILSPYAVASPWVNDEIDLAWKQKNSPAGKRIIPVLYRPCEMREHLDTLQNISFLSSKTYEETFNDLLTTLKLPVDVKMNRTVAVGTILYTYYGHAAAVNAVAWSPDGKNIVSAGYDRTAQIWKASTGDHVFTYQGHSDNVYGVAWSPIGTRIASASGDKTVQVWDATNGNHIITYRRHSSWVTSLTWSPNDIHIASASNDKTVQAWEATTGEDVFTYRGHSLGVASVKWSPIDQRLASASYDGTTRIWQAS